MVEGRRMKKFLTLIVALTMGVGFAGFAAKIVIDHNSGSEANGSFKFKNVPPPAKDDLGAKAKLKLVDGAMDPNGADLSALTDGLLPSEEDQPSANFFFDERTDGGRFRMDLGSAVELSQINTYSWHPTTRGPQLYKLYASDGVDPKFNGEPKRGVDPVSCGWRFIATVSSLPETGEGGGQYAASITDPSGSLGKYRYLLFDCYATENSDDWGNTFYSEVDVLAKK